MPNLDGELGLGLGMDLRRGSHCDALVPSREPPRFAGKPAMSGSDFSFQ
ncbi:MAG: hypothetical protein ACPGU7_04055 [Gammaproteobacteria bacterium]